MRYFALFSCLCLIIGLCFNSAPVAAENQLLAPDERDRFLAELEEELGEVESVFVRFRQERNLDFFAEPVVSEGVLAFVRPDRLHWEWVTPYPSVLVLNRGHIERFDIEGGELRRLRPAGEDMLRSVAMQMTRWMRGQFRESSELFDIEVTAGAPATIILATRSAELRKALERVEVKLLPEFAGVNSVTLIAPGDERTVMEFSGEERNRALDEALFDLDQPTLVGAEINETESD